MNLTATVPSYHKQYSSYMNADGTYSFVRNNFLQMNGGLSITQNVWLTLARSCRSTPRSTGSANWRVIPTT